MFGPENIVHRGMVIYKDEDKVIRSKNAPPPDLSGENIPTTKASVENESTPLACCIIQETKPFDPYHWH